MASISHLHSETEILPVDDSLSLLCSQFLTSSLRSHHPSHSLITQPSGPRSMKETLQSRFLSSVTPHLVDGGVASHTYTQAICSLHTAAIRQTLASVDVNRVL